MHSAYSTASANCAANPLKSSRRVSGKLGISQSGVVCHLNGHSESIRRCRIVPNVIKTLQNFLLAQADELLVWFGLVFWHINNCRLFNNKSIFIHIKEQPTTPLQRGKTPSSTRIPDMTLNNLMVTFQWCWSFGECWAPFHSHCSQIHSGPKK